MRIGSKGVDWSSSTTALILGAVALLLVFAFFTGLLSGLFQFADEVVTKIIKKPFCCGLLHCTSWTEVEASKLNPVCSLPYVCWGVCD